MKKILHISKYYYPYAGGIEDVCYNVVRIIQEHTEFRQKVICFNDSRKTVYDSWEGIQVIRVGVVSKVASQALSWKYGKELKKLLRDFQPDCIHFHAPNPFVAFLLLQLIPQKCKLIVHWHSDIIAQKYLYTCIRPVEKALLQWADIVVATSSAYAEKSLPLQPYREKLKIIPNMIDPHKFVFTEEVKKQVQKIKVAYREKPLLLFVGRHVPYKGLAYLIKGSVGIHPECEILIGGQGPLTPILKQQCISPNVHFIGKIPAEELVAYYYAADIFVFPSITKNEAFGVVLAEAMYCYTPAITFTIEGSGVNWVNLHQVTGLEVENGNVALLVKAINDLLENEAQRLQYAQQAHNRVERLFCIENVAAEIVGLYA